ncbi:MAG: DNA/RNA non-specific endonuclease [Acidobacteria bacterium]|nr:DNA/RNA non-specific endonuclease [Acidobacteriota bacterium]MCW5950013.1 DNA/RNA non-specific endonuclease [Pyrinomonadaceae bacterium]
MKQYFRTAATVVMMAVINLVGIPVSAQKEQAQGSNAVSTSLVISQIYGGGGNASGVYTHDFVEIFNRGSQPVNLANWTVQYASSAGTNWLPSGPLPNFSLQPGQYYLLQFASSGAIGQPLPTPDYIVPILNPEGFIPNLSATTGKLSLVNIADRLPALSCPTDASIIDMIGYGTASCFEGQATPALTQTTGAIRKGGGCQDTDNNNNDFQIGPPAPRNSSTALNPCDLGGALQAGINANPNSVAPTQTTRLTVSVVPATTPPSTGITVTGDLTDIGLSANQQFFDNGTNGDQVPNDNVFTYDATIPAGIFGGVRNVTAVAADGQGRTVNLNQIITINAPLPGDDPLLFGNPSGATPDIANENNYLMPKPQYTLSYNRSKATPNWVAWRLDSSWIGSTPRQDDFRADPALPAGWFAVGTNDYSGSGYDRGHMCPSGDRTNSVPNNSATFLMTNMVPQLPANNQGPWEDFESYCRTLASQGNEIYIISGPVGNIGTISSGRIVVPQYTWKVILVLPNGTNDLQRVTRQTRAFGVVVPNFTPLDINAPWRNFRTTVDAVENLTGYNFFSEIPKNTQELIERRRDTL